MSLDNYHASPELTGGAVFFVYGDRELQGDWFFEDVPDRIGGARLQSRPEDIDSLGIDAALLGDIDRDGEKDLGLAHDFSFASDGGVVVVLGTGGLNGAIQIAKEIGRTRRGFFVRVAGVAAVDFAGDFDNDGLDDFAVLDRRYVFSSSIVLPSRRPQDNGS